MPFQQQDKRFENGVAASFTNEMEKCTQTRHKYMDTPKTSHFSSFYNFNLVNSACVCGILDLERNLLPNQSDQCPGEWAFMEVGSRYLSSPVVFILGQAGFEPTTSGVRVQCLNH